MLNDLGQDAHSGTGRGMWRVRRHRSGNRHGKFKTGSSNQLSRLRLDALHRTLVRFGGRGPFLPGVGRNPVSKRQIVLPIVSKDLTSSHYGVQAPTPRLGRRPVLWQRANGGPEIVDIRLTQPRSRGLDAPTHHPTRSRRQRGRGNHLDGPELLIKVFAQTTSLTTPLPSLSWLALVDRPTVGSQPLN